VAGNAVRLKMPDENGQYPAPKVRAEVIDGKVRVAWDKINSKKFKGYRVVVSRYDSTPSYPDNGYYAWIDDRGKTSIDLCAGDYYHDGDFGGRLKAGDTYYFSVTAVYDGRNVPGNVVLARMPTEAELYPVPEVFAEVSGDKVAVRWNRISSSKFKEYRVVVSGDDSSPAYPDDGYFSSITDRDRNSEVIYAGDSYHNGDFGENIQSGETYYFTVTAVYDNRYVTGNSIQLTMP
jgi:hypothetical protein